MASLYVHALTDVPLGAWNDGRRRIESLAVEGLFAVCERRSTSPPISEAELRWQHAIVQRIAEAVPAALPARFGSLVDEAELALMIRDRRDVIRAALDRVRGRVQMTVRIVIDDACRPALTPSQPLRRARPGRAYLEARLRRASPPVPPRTRKALKAVARWVVEERRTRTVERLVTVYHLVRREDVSTYEAALAEAGVEGMRVTGPWPPFAFVPELARLRLRP